MLSRKYCNFNYFSGNGKKIKISSPSLVKWTFSVRLLKSFAVYCIKLESFEQVPKVFSFYQLTDFFHFALSFLSALIFFREFRFAFSFGFSKSLPLISKKLASILRDHYTVSVLDLSGFFEL